MAGSAVMYDLDKIFCAGGSDQIAVAFSRANNRAHIIDISGPEAVVEQQPNMGWPRIYLNLVVLPNGKIVILGGQATSNSFSDEAAVLIVEMFDPVTKSYSYFKEPLTNPRTYHSVGLLMKDGRVLSGGGGLCANGCEPDTSWVRNNRISLCLECLNALTFNRTLFLTIFFYVTESSKSGGHHAPLPLEQHRWCCCSARDLECADDVRSQWIDFGHNGQFGKSYICTDALELVNAHGQLGSTSRPFDNHTTKRCCVYLANPTQPRARSSRLLLAVCHECCWCAKCWLHPAAYIGAEISVLPTTTIEIRSDFNNRERFGLHQLSALQPGYRCPSTVHCRTNFVL